LGDQGVETVQGFSPSQGRGVIKTLLISFGSQAMGGADAHSD
jgi:hypothetical protein